MTWRGLRLVARERLDETGPHGRDARHGAQGDFDSWRAAFARDPIGRAQAGVRRYRVFRPTHDPRYVLIDLDFDQQAEAQAFLEALRGVWARADLSPGLARDWNAVPPRTAIVEEVDRGQY